MSGGEADARGAEAGGAEVDACGAGARGADVPAIVGRDACVVAAGVMAGG